LTNSFDSTISEALPEISAGETKESDSDRRGRQKKEKRGRQKKEKERQQAEEAAKHSNASSNVKH
jgi:hypothetical protein